MKNVTYLFYGFGSEYVLHPLYLELKKRGYDCCEIDALNIKNSKKFINNLINKDIILITSAQLLLDLKNYKDFYPTTNKFYSILEIISLLKPKKSILIPHDLTEPLITHENFYLNQFDLFLSPCEPFTSIYSAFCKTEEVGWIKYFRNNNEKIKQSKNKAIWFISDFILHIKMGKKTSLETVLPILKQGVSVKFPYWDKSDEFEEYYAKNGISIYSAKTSSIELIKKHDVVLTNGLSSIIAESYFMGKTTLNVTEGSHYGNMRSCLEELFPNLIFIESINQFKLNDISVKKQPNILQPFNMEKTLKLITQS